MFLVRDVQRRDLPELKKLASELNTVNLPDNQEMLASLIDKSVKSFTGSIEDALARQYLFVAEDVANKAEREHYSASLDRHFRHKVLSIGYNYAGPTEIGGLVVAPPYRSSVEKVGRQLSYIRFLFIAMHRAFFRDKVLAELLPPLLPDGRSLLWEAIGKKFTGLSYQEADHLSRQNKEFIKELFPASDIYVSLFPDRTQRVVGEVAPNTRGVKRMLERVGFRYVERIDPFDGGPHYEAKVDDISAIKLFRTARLEKGVPGESEKHWLVAHQPSNRRTRFRAVKATAEFAGNQVRVAPEVRDHLQAPVGARVALIPFD